jgi:hypothetical protein
VAGIFPSTFNKRMQWLPVECQEVNFLSGKPLSFLTDWQLAVSGVVLAKRCFEQLLVVAGDEVAGDDGADAGACRPLDEVVDEGRGELAEAECVFLDLLREEVEAGVSSPLVGAK